MKITDAHLHSWDLSRVKYDWLSAAEGTILHRNYLPEDLYPQLEEAGVGEAVLVQSANSLEDSEYMFDLSDRHGWITGVVAWLPLTDPALTHRLLGEYQKHPSFKGIRHLMHVEPDDDWLTGDAVMESLGLLSDASVSFDAIAINSRQVRSILQVAERQPRLRIVMDHLSQPPLTDAAAGSEWRALMRDAALLPNLHAKFSGLGTMPRPADKSPEESLKPAVGFILEHFGTSRCFCGGDWPISLLDRGYADTWKTCGSILRSLTTDPAQLTSLLEDNARKFYRL